MEPQAIDVKTVSNYLLRMLRLKIYKILYTRVVMGGNILQLFSDQWWNFQRGDKTVDGLFINGIFTPG